MCRIPLACLEWRGPPFQTVGTAYDKALWQEGLVILKVPLKTLGLEPRGWIIEAIGALPSS